MGKVRTLARLVAFAGPVRTQYLLGVLGLGLVNFGLNACAAYIMLRLTRGLLERNRALLAASVIELILAGAGAAVVIFLSAVALMRGATRTEGALRSALLGKLLTAPLSALEPFRSGNLMSRLNADLARTSALYRQSLQGLAGVLVNGIGSTVLVLLIDVRAGLLVIGLSATALLLPALTMAALGRQSRDLQQEHAGVLHLFGQLIRGAGVIRLFDLGPWMLAKMEARTRALARAGVKLAATEAIQAEPTTVELLVTLGIFLYGGYRSAADSAFLPTLIALFQLSTGTTALFSRLAGVFGDLQVRLAAGQRLMELLDLQDEPQRLSFPAGPAPAPAAGLSVQGLHFSYPGSAAPVLQDLSLSVAAGQCAAFVGPSGGGKSTLFKLLLGLYPPERGNISFGGVALHAAELGEWRGRLAYVSQRPFLFHDTLYANIVGDRPDPGPRAVEEAARLAGAHEFIVALPDGYRTVVREGALDLSGGQRQRIAIARAFLQDAPLLLLDEPTASLDLANAQTVQQALQRLRQGRTTLVIAHRLATILDADRVFFVESGRIVEEGNPRELGQVAGGKYRRLADGR